MRISIVVGILAALLYVGYRMTVAEGATKTTYVTAEVVRDRLQEVVTSTGTVDAVVNVEVGSQLSGRIAAIEVDFNDTVRKGQALAVLDQQSYQASLSKAAAALQMARALVMTRKAELARARESLRRTEAMKVVLESRRDSARARFDVVSADLRRKRKLGTGGTVSESALEQVRADQLAASAALREAEANLAAHEIDLAAARAEIEREKAELESAIANIPEKEATLKLAEIELERTTIRSPIDGVVINRKVDAGQTVAASLEAPTLFRIAQDLSEMEVHVRIDETDIGRISLGQTANFTVDAYRGRQFTGRVVQIRKSPEVIRNVVTYTVVVRTRNDDLLLLPGMTALVKVIVKRSDERLLIPTAALRYVPGGAGQSAATVEPSSGTARVWRLVDGVPVPVRISTGDSDTRFTVLAGGPLKTGDDVIVNEVVQQASGEIFGIRLGF